MPVTGIYFIQDPTTPPPSTLLIDRLSKLHQPLFLGKWTFEHRLLRSTTPPPPSTPSTTTATATTTPHNFMQCLDLSAHSHKLFVYAPGVTGSTIATIDRDFDYILRTKLSSLWTPRLTHRGEGWAYEVGDFRVRVGNVVQGEALLKGCVVEVEYGPCAYIEVGERVIRDFVDGLGVGGGRYVFAHEGYEGGREWSVLDTGRQYCEVLRFR